MSSTEPDADEAMPGFAGIISDYNEGTVNDILTADLTEIVQAVQQYGKPGKLTFTLTVTPNGKSGSTVFMIHKIVKNAPEPDAEQSIWYADKMGRLTRDNPLQGKLVDRSNRIVDYDDTPAQRLPDEAPARRLEED